jgi:hypothetical protein
VSVLNNGFGDLESLSLPRLRTRAAAAGVQDTARMTRESIVSALFTLEQETESLRREAQRRGLSTDGDKNTLELRLSATEDGAISSLDRRTYQGAALLILTLGLAGLAVSIPHVSLSLGRIMGVNTLYAVLLALIIDGGIVSLKVVEGLSGKFEMGKVRHLVTSSMIVCLGISALLNGQEFALHCQTWQSNIIAYILACFLSGFVFVMFLIGSYMLLNQHPRSKTDKKNPADALRQAAEEYERLSNLQV